MSGAHLVAIYTINSTHAAYMPDDSNLRAHQPNLTHQFQRFSFSTPPQAPMVRLSRAAIPLRLTDLSPTLCAHANGSWRFQFGAVGWLSGGLGAGPGHFLGLVLGEKAAEGGEEGTATPAGKAVAASRVFGDVPN
jgi:hypothetical protein